MNETFYVVSATVIPVLLIGIRIQMFVSVQGIKQNTRSEQRRADRDSAWARVAVSVALWLSPAAMAMSLFGVTGISGPTTDFPPFDILFTDRILAPLIGVEVVMLCIVAAMHPLLQLAVPTSKE